jgi:nicotinate-nucleotide pyrophosphorylase (carboxylating)
MFSHYNAAMNNFDFSSPAFIQAIQTQVDAALREDVGAGDVSAALISPIQIAQATVIAREDAVVCGIPWATEVFKRLASDIEMQWHVQEGERIQANQTLLSLQGNARALLTGERTALNFLQTLSAVATITRRYADKLVGTKARIMDTRKTLPGLRLAQKYAVAVGGGLNQRLGLYDGILIKENHILAAGSIGAALQAAQALAQTSNPALSIQIEVENCEELQQALEAGAKLVLLDNFSIDTLKQAVSLNQGRAVLEASGGITLESVREIALTGVDRISTGDLTKNIQAVDLSMRFQPLN